jgi:hypothetical protein
MKVSRYPLSRRLDGPQSQSGHLEETKISDPSRESNQHSSIVQPVSAALCSLRELILCYRINVFCTSVRLCWTELFAEQCLIPYRVCHVATPAHLSPLFTNDLPLFVVTSSQTVLNDHCKDTYCYETNEGAQAGPAVHVSACTVIV